MTGMLGFLARIDTNPNVLGGKPVIKNTRIPVSIIFQLLRDGAVNEDIIKEYPRLTIEDIKAGLDYSLYLVHHLDEEEIHRS